MTRNWRKAGDALNKIEVESTSQNQPVLIKGTSDELKCIGIGTDAAVFQHVDLPEYAFKLYAKDKTHKLSIEEGIYQQLGENQFFPTCYGATAQYLVISYEEGITLFDCILQGVYIPKEVIAEVEEARTYVRELGLNPRDIHTKNILLQNGRAKIIDVSEYSQAGNDYRWEHLKKAYDEHYHLIANKPIPFWVVETVRKWYNQRSRSYSTFDDFVGAVLKWTTFSKQNLSNKEEKDSDPK
ncbi:serine/threonine protein kinase [Gracilibacillus salinarum]|uniref:Serine/threonine protein kinase n=1 Tax=Gracilibacillus salinarum TaxID=2932255 RepID=A0ABY4GRT9_9BACI|nr:serine/threonine protein kinase [Gracilibacillus salinarum]UOQ87118.1 serine/threonine protein kinase [Gracilibacillus salinarum]